MSIWQKKIQAGALQFAILISIIIAVIISAFILLSYTQQQFAIQLRHSAQSITLATSGPSFLKQQDIAYKDSTRIRFPDSEEKDFVLYKTHWGIYDKVISLGQSNNFIAKKIALVGGQTSKEDRLALHLEDTDSPLVLVGNSIIKGNVELPLQGVKAGAISGTYYQRDALIEGATRKTGAQKPIISKHKQEYLHNLLFGVLPEQDSLYIQSFDKVATSTFNTSPKWLYRPGVIELQDHEVNNNIIVKSDTLIRISAFAKAENILLIAPHIEIMDSVEGTFQAFASESITVGRDVSLNYPSALVLIDNIDISEDQRDSIDGISLNSGSTITGSILHLGSSTDPYQRAKIRLSKNSLVRGEVYSDETIELLGSIEGSVYTHQVEVSEKGSVYKNHLYNTSINSTNVPTSFSGIQTDDTETTIVEWVY